MNGMAAAYEEVKDVVKSTAKSFHRRHGGHLDDLLADANTLFVKGHKQWEEEEPDDVDYNKHIKRWVWFGLFDDYRTRTGHRNKVKPAVAYEYINQIQDDGALDVFRQFHADEFLEGLSEDAKTTALLALDTPAALQRTILAKGGQIRNFRSSMRDYLKRMGWDTDRINTSFEEVRRALS